MPESLHWKPLAYGNLDRMSGRHLLVVRADGKGYYGELVYYDVEYIELANGNQRQIVKFFDSPAQFTPVAPPVRPTYRLGESRLKLED